ncbi:beta-ketoacyl synthase N-terminal-like domain-containing protein [Hymenobacter endophyticus]|uniref:Beta-ketoacyl synthase N-terminal-like domain-containing protein n=1 Tax=Hymenobacter endophyticus TaxID=3076335 RepID=A0ABU3TJC9_9BACT|nr:beta-ketoacyl synthase N-terminal-like domain-containing protein [Hymenobacter endophyticus]MDU0371477.1 beta-ketoacyl synthase N-terminal-like domain-containing protein [Hymenobacter endophyticus]
MISPIPADKALVVIRGRGRVSALGFNPMPVDAAVSPFTTHATGVPVAAAPLVTEAALAELRRSTPAFRQLDRTVLLALLAARQAATHAGWRALHNQPLIPNQQQSADNLAVSIGSSRGATGRLEEFHAEFLAEGAVSAVASPLTTLGNVASWVAFDAGSTGGTALSHSSTCSSAFQALGNATAWLRAGMATRFLAGGAEAPLTSFTLAQMQAIGIYSPLAAAAWPCRPGAGRPSTFVLGEGAAVFALEKVSRADLATEPPTRPVFLLEGVGFGFEAIGSKTGLSPEGQHFQQAIRQVLGQAGVSPAEVDAVVLHSPGTPAGDAAERAALHAVFGEHLPPLLSNKWLLGHTLGASAALSLDFALHILETQQWPAVPFATDLAVPTLQPIRRILVNAAGFGGNAASALVSVLNK